MVYPATNSKITIYLLLLTVEPLLKYTPKEDKSPFKGQSKSTIVYTLYKITSESGQPLCNGKWLLPTCPLLRDLHVIMCSHWNVVA